MYLTVVSLDFVYLLSLQCFQISVPWIVKTFQKLRNSYHRVQVIDILLKYILWYEFLNELDAKSDLDKIVTKKLVKLNHSYIKYALAYGPVYSSHHSIRNLIFSWKFSTNFFLFSWFIIQLAFDIVLKYFLVNSIHSRQCMHDDSLYW